MVKEMFFARSGKAVFAIMLHAGQQEVAMKFSLLGTSSDVYKRQVIVNAATKG